VSDTVQIQYGRIGTVNSHQAIDVEEPVAVAAVALYAQGDEAGGGDLAEGDEAAGQWCRVGEVAQFGSLWITPAHAQRGVFRGV